MSKVMIKAGSNRINFGLKELVQYRDLFWLLAYRDYRIRYAQTFLGFAWAFIQPLATLIIFTVVFGFAVKVDTSNTPYPLFAACGMAGWTFFAYVLGNSGNSIVGAQQMIKKIYFPRLVIPLSKAIVGLVDFGITLFFILLLSIYYGVVPSHHIVFLPVFIALTVITSLAVGIWMSALTIRYRDFQHIIPFLVQIGMYATPVAYPTGLVIRNLPEWATLLFFANPMAGIVEGYRWSILGIGAINHLSFVSYSVVFVLFIGGLLYFKRMERVMADII